VRAAKAFFFADFLDDLALARVKIHPNKHQQIEILTFDHCISIPNILHIYPNRGESTEGEGTDE
jgi:hypothetical protein